MFFLKLINYLAGYLTILVWGDAPEKFMNMAAARGIFLWSITRLDEDRALLNVRVSAIRPLRHIARKTGCRFHIQHREGLPFLIETIKRRKALALGAIIFLAALYVLSSFVWFVEVKGNQRVPQVQILKAAEKAGLERGVSKSKINIGSVEKNIQEQLPDVSWVGVYIKGTRATIEVVEKAVVPEKEPEMAHIIARKGGLVEEILVLRGHPEVKKGDTVVEGQVLISGIIPPLEADEHVEVEKKEKPKPEYVCARGIVRARVWYEGYAEEPLVETGQRYTGRVFTRLSMKIGTKEIILMGSQDIPYESYTSEAFIKTPPDWRNLSLPVELITVKYREMKKYKNYRSRIEGRRLAGEKALREIQQQLPQGALILRRSVEDLVTNQPESIVRVRAFVETLEEIGVVKPFRKVNKL